MITTVLDIETSYRVDADKKTDAEPYTGNLLVSVGTTVKERKITCASIIRIDSRQRTLIRFCRTYWIRQIY